MYCIGYFRHCNTDGYNRWEEQNLWVSSEEELIATVKGMQNNPIYKILGFSKETPMSKEEENKIYSEASKLSEKEKSVRVEKIDQLNKLMDREIKNKIPFDWPCKEEKMAISYRVSYKTTESHTLNKSEEVSWCENKECLVEKLRQLEDRPSVYSDIIVTVHSGKVPEEEIKPNHKAIADIEVLMRQFKINEDQIQYIFNEMNQSQDALDSCKTLKDSYLARIRAIYFSLTDVDKAVLRTYSDFVLLEAEYGMEGYF